MTDGEYEIRDLSGHKMLGAQSLEELHRKLGEQIGQPARAD